MPEKQTSSLTLRHHLRKAGIRHYNELIHDQPRAWLIKNFSQGADEYPVNRRDRKREKVSPFYPINTPFASSNS